MQTLVGNFVRVDHCVHSHVLCLMTFHADSDLAELRKVPEDKLKKPENGTEWMIVEYLL